jgi:hypothetical protein
MLLSFIEFQWLTAQLLKGSIYINNSVVCSMVTQEFFILLKIAHWLFWTMHWGRADVILVVMVNDVVIFNVAIFVQECSRGKSF